MKEINDFIKKAEKFLKTAELVLDSGDYDSCVSRCYYAMFFMAEAALLTKSLWASTLKGVISLFGEHFVKTRIFEREICKSLTDVHDALLIGDYEVGFTITPVGAEFAAVAAKRFVQVTREHPGKEMKIKVEVSMVRRCLTGGGL